VAAPALGLPGVVVCHHQRLPMVTGCVTALLATLASLSMAVSCMDPADSHSARSLLCQFLVETLIDLRGRRALGRLRQASSHLLAAQTAILTLILRHNESTNYGRRHRFDDVLATARTEGKRHLQAPIQRGELRGLNPLSFPRKVCTKIYGSIFLLHC